MSNIYWYNSFVLFISFIIINKFNLKSRTQLKYKMNNFFQNNHRRVRSAKNDSKDSSYLNGSYIHQRHLETEESFYNR
jgi:hypothetical protein